MRKRAIYYRDARGFNPVWQFISDLPPDERDKCIEYINYLEEVGEQVKRPIGDYLGDKLYELRPKKNRIIYFFVLKDCVVLLHAFRKKTNAVPVADITTAKKKMGDFLARYAAGQIRIGESS